MLVSAPAVTASTMPLTVRPLLLWNCRTAVSVPAPKLDACCSAAGIVKLSRASSLCNSATSAPVRPWVRLRPCRFTSAPPFQLGSIFSRNARESVQRHPCIAAVMTGAMGPGVGEHAEISLVSEFRVFRCGEQVAELDALRQLAGLHELDQRLAPVDRFQLFGEMGSLRRRIAG